MLTTPDAGFEIHISAFGLDDAAKDALFERVTAAAHALNEQVVCAAGFEVDPC